MFEMNALLAGVRCILPENERLPGRGRGTDWAIVSNKYLMTPDGHLEKYSQVKYILNDLAKSSIFIFNFMLIIFFSDHYADKSQKVALC